jgi:hypothetical protein
MGEEKTKKCAHPACNCPAAEGSKYCSQYCKDAGTKTEISCNCGHAGCSMTEHVFTAG